MYDLVEFVANNHNRYNFRDSFIKSCNAILEKEVSAYRFVDGLISRITEQEQLEEIELALAKARGPVQMPFGVHWSFYQTEMSPITETR